MIPPRLDREGVEHYRLKIERLLNRLSWEAEAWAEAGTPKIDEVPLRRQPSPLTLPGQQTYDSRPGAVVISSPCPVLPV